MKKTELLNIFRKKADECLKAVDKPRFDSKMKAAQFNQLILQYRNERLEAIERQDVDNPTKLNEILLTTYVCNVVMLEYRNIIWPYDYMAFSRRIGEIWEPFCKIPFHFPVKRLEFYTPPKFTDIQKALSQKIRTAISKLGISAPEKEELLQYYDEVWKLIDSGSINLKLDLQFKQDGQYYDIDYKSGFSSNEKGNTNRLLLVGSIFSSLPEKHNNLIFVRQKEEENNHYLQTLKRSDYWEVFCADEAYDKIKEFSGFDLKSWMDENMKWTEDISPVFKKYLEEHALLKYLTW